MPGEGGKRQGKAEVPCRAWQACSGTPIIYKGRIASCVRWFIVWGELLVIASILGLLPPKSLP
ncbi:hypothetical protein [Porphyromonas endodontalis]